MLPAASPLLALAVAAAGTVQLGIRGETRAFSGGPADHGGLALDAYQLDPSIAVGLEGGSGTLRLSVTYAPSLLFPSPTGRFGDAGAASTYHTGSAMAAWEDARSRIALTALGARGFRVVTPLSQALVGGAPGGAETPVASPQDRSSLQPSAGVRAAPFTAAGIGTAAAASVGRRLRVSASASYLEAGGQDEAARLLFPRQRGLQGEARAAWLAGPLDTLALLGTATRIRFDAAGTASLAGVTARWEHLPSPGWRSYLEAGAAVTEAGREGLHPVVDVGCELEERAAPLERPRDDAGAGDGEPTPGRPWHGRIRARLSPYLDAFTETASTRLEAGGDVGWRSGAGFRVEASAARASVVSRSQWGPSVGIGQLGLFWRLGRNVEAGLLARGGWQSGALPAGAPWQWGIALDVSWRSRASL